MDAICNIDPLAMFVIAVGGLAMMALFVLVALAVWLSPADDDGDEIIRQWRHSRRDRAMNGGHANMATPDKREAVK